MQNACTVLRDGGNGFPAMLLRDCRDVIQRDGTTKEVDRSWRAVRACVSTVQKLLASRRRAIVGRRRELVRCGTELIGKVCGEGEGLGVS